jgi:hypothetical protein
MRELGLKASPTVLSTRLSLYMNNVVTLTTELTTSGIRHLPHTHMSANYQFGVCFFYASKSRRGNSFLSIYTAQDYCNFLFKQPVPIFFILLSQCIFTHYSVTNKCTNINYFIAFINIDAFPLHVFRSVGECIDINKSYKVVYVCAFVGY